MNFNNDEYTCDIDQLGYKKQADTIRRLIMECDTPYAIGISGRWGSGKTSMMKYIMASLGGQPLQHRLRYQDGTLENLTEKNNFDKVQAEYTNKMPPATTCLWFNPWEHENNDEPFVELLREIHHYFATTVTGKDAKRIAHTTVMAGLDMLGSFFKLGNNAAGNIKKIGEAYEHDNFESVHRSQQFKLVFQQAVKKLLMGCHGIEKDTEKETAIRLVIFIDDLDRCEKSVVARLLKDIKQHLSTKHCVFVFGYDRHHIESSMSQNQDRSSKDSRAYLEKLFQSTVYIKQPTSTKLNEYISAQLNQGPIDFVEQPHLGELANFLQQILDPNPRRLKAFFTAFYLHVKTSNGFADETTITLDDLKKLALLSYLKLFYEPVYSALENDNDLLEELKDVFSHQHPAQIDNYQQAFIHLETRSHLSATDVDFSQSGLEEGKAADEKKEVRLSPQLEKIYENAASENKFVNEVQQMQGKHKSHGHFMQQFIAAFQAQALADFKHYL